MKNLFLVAVIGLFSATTIYAQSDDTTIQFGVKGGVNLANITSDDIGDSDQLTSFHLGLFMEIPISERFSFQPEVLYSGQGFSAFNEEAEYKMDYIQVPLMAKVYIVKGLYAEAGPQFGFKVKEEIDYKPGSEGGEIEINTDDSYIKNFDTNLALGAGYKFDNGLSLSARYNLGLTNIYKDNTLLQNVDAKNSVWQFGVGFSF
ncbi:porin family protein [Gelidibacter gilvus]|uniref:PorT family protein n=1 Tax=Gelidibacter gilvus TaxID=59602 RepID=A0A4Q0XL98_9FLAO|nr:porin family protein [Gelidibacter gilvus]RXJ51382.1 PorT family protein [Gelidibacter gilvus]